MLGTVSPLQQLFEVGMVIIPITETQRDHSMASVHMAPCGGTGTGSRGGVAPVFLITWLRSLVKVWAEP